MDSYAFGLSFRASRAKSTSRESICPLSGNASSGTHRPTTARLSRSLARTVSTSMRTDLQAVTSFISLLPVTARFHDEDQEAVSEVPFPESLVPHRRPGLQAPSSPNKAEAARRPSRRQLLWRRRKPQGRQLSKACSSLRYQLLWHLCGQGGLSGLLPTQPSYRCRPRTCRSGPSANSAMPPKAG